MNKITQAKSFFSRNLINAIGFKTNRKLLVIESDDWGTIRTASQDSYKHLLKKGYPVDKNAYNKYDALESNKDLESLFEVLSSVKDKNNNPAILTANNIVCNPDFKKIKESNYENYYFEPFTETLKNYPNHDRVMQLYSEGIDDKLIRPQFHGREHLNVNRWMRDLKKKSQHVMDGFDENMFSFHWMKKNKYKNEYMDALDCDDQGDLTSLTSMINEGASIFKDIWGFSSKSFIANCYIWPKEIESILLNNEIEYIQGLPIQFTPILKEGYQYRKKYHYLGQKNSIGQIYLVRNAFFEPSVYPEKDWVNECLYRVELAFNWRKPAIISSHRLNFMGSLNQNNRDKNLTSLKLLLKNIVKKWPDVEFITSDQLGSIIKGN